MQVPGLTATFNVPANAFVLITSTGGAQSSSSGSGGTVELGVYADGAIQYGSKRRLVVPGSSSGPVYWSVSQIVDFTPGNHTVTFEAYKGGGANVDVSGPDGALLQGSLTVLILNK